MNKNDRDITPSSNGEDGERMRERGREREGERRIIPISAARVVGLSNQSVAAPEDGNSAASLRSSYVLLDAAPPTASA